MVSRRDPFDEFAFLIGKETATSLGFSGKALDAALRALAAFDSGQKAKRQSVSREQLVKSAVDALQGLLIQKELNGISDNRALNQAYCIPAELWRYLGFAEAPK